MLLLRGQLQRAASRGRAARPITAPASAEVCGNDVNSEHGGGGDGDQPAAAIDPRVRDTIPAYTVYLLQPTHSKSVPVQVSRCA